MTLREKLTPGHITHTIRLTAILLFLTAGSARAEFVFSLFSAKTIDENSDVHLKQSGGTDLNFHDAHFRGKDFESPQYYGIRAAYFLHEDRPGLGFGIEFFHAKEYMKTDGSLRVTGTRSGVPVNDREPVDNTIQNFNNSHGMNFLLADVFYRWAYDDTHNWLVRRLRPYLAVGAGVVIPHVESQVYGVRHEEYQVGGPGVQAMAGLDFKVSKHFSLFTEYKFTYADLDEKIPKGSIRFEPMAHHFVGGMSVHF